MNDETYVTDALRAWASTHPRRATKLQRWSMSLTESTQLILDSEDKPNDAPFISTYSFPYGHTSDGKIPRIDRLFFDFDIPHSGTYRSGDNDVQAWKDDMGELLSKARKVAQFLQQSDRSDCWQAALSGHKGIHLDLVFPVVGISNGDYEQFKTGMASYSDAIISHISEVTGLDNLDQWVDVDSSDLGRLRRVPNTKHLGASRSFNEDRFCVPVTLTELANLTAEQYIKLTRSRRQITDSMTATPNEKAAEVLTQQIRTAQSSYDKSFGGSSSRASTVNTGRIQAYTQNANDSITVDDLPFVLSDRPCVLEFVNREDAFQHGAASHLMEMKVITEMMEKNVPIETMIDFFNQHPKAREDYTRERIGQYISRKYKPVSCETIWNRADSLCLKEGCQIWVDSVEQNR